MASTAMKTVEGHQGATRPDCTPAPGANRALACAALAAGFALALAWLAVGLTMIVPPARVRAH